MSEYFSTQGVSTDIWLGSKVVGDDNDSAKWRFVVEADGKIRWAPGTSCNTDVILQRSDLSTLNTTDPRYWPYPLLTLYRGDGTTGGDLKLGTLIFKDSGNIIVVDGSYSEVQTKSGYTLTDDCAHLFCTKINPVDRNTSTNQDPKLATEYGFFVGKDFQTFGFVGTSSDPCKGDGGGAIMMGQGYTGLYCPSYFDLTGYFSYPFGDTLPSSGLEGEFFWKIDTKVLYRYESGQWNAKSSSTSILGGYPTCTSTTKPTNPTNGQWIYTTDEKKLYQYWTTAGPGHSAGWNQMFSNVQSAFYDTLFLIQADTQGPANLHLRNLTATDAIYADHLNSASGSGIYLFDSLHLYYGTAGIKLYDSTNSAPANYFLSTNASGYPVWVPSSATWNGGTVTQTILPNVTGTLDIGSTGLRFRDAWFTGAGTFSGHVYGGSYVESGGYLITAGNAGIGTSSITPIGTNYGTVDIRGSNGGGLRFGVASGNSGGIYTDASNLYIFTANSMPIQFYPNNTLKATLDTSGNMNISGSLTANYNGLFGLSSGRYYISITSNSYPELRYTRSTTEHWRIGVADGGSYGASLGDYYLYSAVNGTMPFIFKPSGQMVIGNGVYLSNDANSTLRIASAFSSVTIGAQNSSCIHFMSNGGLPFYFNNDVVANGHLKIYNNGANICDWYGTMYNDNGVGTRSAVSGLQTSGDIYTPNSIQVSGGIQFSYGSASVQLVWSNNHVLSLIADSASPFAYLCNKDPRTGETVPNYTAYFGALDCGAVFCQYINPIGTTHAVQICGATFNDNYATDPNSTMLTGNLHSANSGSGGTYIDTWGNMRQSGGSWSNSWNIYNLYGNCVLNIPFSGGASFYDGNGNVKMGITNGGNISTVGTMTIGSFASSSTPLYISGNTIAKNTSSIRFKENIETLSDCSWIYKLRLVNFDWKNTERARREGRQFGFIAEEVHEVCPTLTWSDEKGQVEGVRYEMVGVATVAELQKLRREVDELKAKLAAA